MRKITVKWEGNCTRCQANLEVGMLAMYEKMTGIFCVGCEPQDTEEIRKFRIIKAEVRTNKLIGKAERLEKEAERKAAPLEYMRGDTAFFTQPGHIPARARMFRAANKAGELSKEAREVREKARGVMVYKTRVAGDAERAREEERKKQDLLIGKGSRVYDFCFGEGEVIGIYPKSYRIRFDRGFTYSRDKTYVKLIDKAKEEDL